MEPQEGASPDTNGSTVQLGIPPAAGCLVSLLVGLIGVGCVVAVLGLAFRGEVAFARGTPTETRLWLINDGGNQGLAFSRGNVFENDAASGEICARTRVRFLLWRSSEPSENVEYCECFRQEGGRYQLIGTCEP